MNAVDVKAASKLIDEVKARKFDLSELDEVIEKLAYVTLLGHNKVGNSIKISFAPSHIFLQACKLEVAFLLKQAEDGLQELGVTV